MASLNITVFFILTGFDALFNIKGVMIVLEILASVFLMLVIRMKIVPFGLNLVLGLV